MLPRGGLLVVLAGLVALAGCADSDDVSVPGTGGSSSVTTVASDVPPSPAPSASPPVGDAPASSESPRVTDAPAGTDAPPGPGPSRYDFDAVSATVAEFVDERSLNGAGLVIVDREHGVVHEEHWGEFSPSRVSLVASSSKMITAGVLMRLDDEGLLDVDAPVAEVVDWGTANPDITPAQLVSNSSGLVGLLPDPGYGPYVCQFVAVGTLQDCAAAIFTTSGDDADVVPPDTEFRYGGAQWQVAGAVAEAASGKSWDELIQEIYVDPCGLDTLAFNNHFTQIGTGGFDYPIDFGADPSVLAPTDNPNMEGGAYVTTGDYATLLLMHLRGGMCDGTRVLSEAAVARMHDDRIVTYGGDAGPGFGYGMGWWVDRATGRISDGGAYGSVPWLDLEDGYGAYLVIEADAGTGNELAMQLYDLVDAAMNA